MTESSKLSLILLAVGLGLHALGDGWDPIRNVPPTITFNPVIPPHELASYFKLAVVVRSFGIALWVLGLGQLIVDVLDRLLPNRAGTRD
jgi:hypothetical protein